MNLVLLLGIFTLGFTFGVWLALSLRDLKREE